MSAPFLPDWVSPPGATLEDVLTERGDTPLELAQRSGLSQRQVGNIISGAYALTPYVCRLLACHIGASSRFWRRRERHYAQELLRLRKQRPPFA